MAWTMPTLHVITLGHKQHGKSIFTAALGGAFGAAAPKSLTLVTSGLTIGGLVYEYATSRQHIVHLDSACAEEAMKYLIACDPVPDVAVVVVSASHGPAPETREQIALAHAMGIRNLIVFLNKCDSVTNPYFQAESESECRAILSQFDFPGEHALVVRGSALRALDGDDAWTPALLEVGGHLDGCLPTSRSLDPSPHSKYECNVYLHSMQEHGRQRPFDARYKPTVRIRDTDVVAGIALSQVPWGFTGDWSRMVHTLPAPIPLAVGQRLTMREEGRVVGLGCVTKILE